MNNSKTAGIPAYQQETSQAKKIREATREILEANNGLMAVGELIPALKKRKITVRSDFLISTLSVSGSGFDIQPRFGVTNVRLRPAAKEGIKMKKKTDKLTVEQFVLRAIETLANPGYKGIHTVISGFNNAFRAYFPDLDPIEETRKLASADKIVIRPVKGGVMIFKKGDASPATSSADALKRMGLK